MKKTNRESNFELLRILAMVLIIIHHIFVHGINVQINDPNTYGVFGIFNNLLFYKRLALSELAISFGKIGTDLFILISGYFCINKTDLKIKDKIIKLLSQLLFAVVILLICSTLYNKFIDNSFKYFVNLETFSKGFWFIGYYLLIIIIGEIFINPRIINISKEKYSKLIWILTAVVTLSFIVNMNISLIAGLDVFLTGIYLYLLGGYISKYKPFDNIRSYVFIIIMIITYAFIILTFRNNQITNYLTNINDINVFHPMLFESFIEYSISCMIIAISTFELFRRIRIKNNKVINYISAATFMTYLIHDNDFVRGLFRKISWIPMYANDLKSFLLYILCIVLIVLSIGIVAYSSYILLNKIIKSKTIKRLILNKNN